MSDVEKSFMVISKIISANERATGVELSADATA